jgi:hypothetical protein
MNKKNKFLINYNQNKRRIISKDNNSIFWSYLYKKRFKLKANKHINKKRFAYFKMKTKPLILYIFTPKVLPIFLNKLKFFKKFCILNIVSKDKNFFFNYSNIKGDVIKNYSCGLYFKGSLKRSYYAINALLFKSNFINDYNLKNKKFLINIWSRYKDLKLKRNIKDFIIEKTNYNIILVNYVRLIAHNGVRSRKQRRK